METNKRPVRRLTRQQYEEMQRRKRRKRMRQRRNIALLVITVAIVTGVGFGVNALIKSSKDLTDKNSSSSSNVAQSEQTEKDYDEIKMTAKDIHEGDLILVNNDNEYKFTEERELASVFNFKTDLYSVKDTSVEIDSKLEKNFNSMLGAYQKTVGENTINVISGKRTKEYQTELYDNYVKNNGEEYAKNYCAQPGYSEHHTGLAFDLGVLYKNTGQTGNFDGTGDLAWFNENSYKYGFIERYQDAKKEITGIYYEPWHFRYIGKPHAYIMQKEGLCFEEYIDYLRDFSYDGSENVKLGPKVFMEDIITIPKSSRLKVTVGKSDYEIYFTNSKTVKVPKNKSYEISGNNIDGFIVTVKL